MEETFKCPKCGADVVVWAVLRIDSDGEPYVDDHGSSCDCGWEFLPYLKYELVGDEGYMGDASKWQSIDDVKEYISVYYDTDKIIDVDILCQSILDELGKLDVEEVKAAGLDIADGIAAKHKTVQQVMEGF